jgi:hypothetical protein
MEEDEQTPRRVPETTMSSREVEVGLDQFLNSFRESGEEENCGAVIVKSLLSSR